MKTVFLDIDGVLRVGGKGPLNPTCIANLNRLTASAGASIVVSSTWRRAGLKYIRGVLREAGVAAKIYGVTPDLSNDRGRVVIAPERCVEIKSWLEDHPNVTGIVILDDDDMAGLKSYLVRTDPYKGLTAENVERARCILDMRYRG